MLSGREIVYFPCRIVRLLVSYRAGPAGARRAFFATLEGTGARKRELASLLHRYNALASIRLLPALGKAPAA